MTDKPSHHNRWGLGKKIFLWSLLSMVWVVALGGTGLLFIHRVADVSLSLVNGQAVPMIEVGKIEKGAWEIYLRGILHAGLTSPEEMDRLNVETVTLTAQWDQHIAVYGDNPDVDKAWIAALLEAQQQFRSVMAHSQALSADFAKEEAMRLLVLEGKKAFDQMLLLVNGEGDRRWKSMTVLRRDAEFNRNHAIQWISVITLVFGLVVVGGWWYGRSIRSSLGQVTNALVTSITQMGTAIGEQERIISQQAVSVNETNATMETLGISARQMAEQADLVASGSRSALAFSQQGSETVSETVRSMESAKEQSGTIGQKILVLSEQMGQIRAMTDLVSDFANETKMLAMNAAVEAVRAGEHGKGFSVLAVETRKLADESKRSAGQIRELVDKIQKITDMTVMAVDEGEKAWQRGISTTQNTAATFESLGEAVGSASEGTQQISMNVRQQSVAVRQVVETMRSINNGAKEVSLGISQVRLGIQTLGESAQILKRMI